MANVNPAETAWETFLANRPAGVARWTKFSIGVELRNRGRAEFTEEYCIDVANTLAQLRQALHDQFILDYHRDNGNRGRLQRILVQRTLTDLFRDAAISTATDYMAGVPVTNMAVLFESSLRVVDAADLSLHSFVVVVLRAAQPQFDVNQIEFCDAYVYRINAIVLPTITVHYIDVLNENRPANMPQPRANPPGQFSCVPGSLLLLTGDIELDFSRDFPVLAAATAATSVPSAQFSNLVDKIDTISDSQAKRKTPAGHGLTASAAAVLSREPENMRKRGNNETFNHLLACSATHPLLLSYGIRAIRFQLQPAQLLTLVRSWDSLPLDVFASLLDRCNDDESLIQSLVFRLDFDNVHDLVVDTSIIGGFFHHFQNAIHNFCATITALFDLKDDIASSLHDAAERLEQFVDGHRKPTNDPRTPLLFACCFRYFAAAVNTVYRGILGGILTTSQAVCNGLNLIPAISKTSDHLMIEATAILARNVKESPPRPMNKRKSPPSNSPNPRPIPAAAVEAVAQGVCCKYLSVQGCKRVGGCRFAHRPATASEESFIVHWFTENKEYIRKK